MADEATPSTEPKRKRIRRVDTARLVLLSDGLIIVVVVLSLVGLADNPPAAGDSARWGVWDQSMRGAWIGVGLLVIRAAMLAFKLAPRILGGMLSRNRKDEDEVALSEWFEANSLFYGIALFLGVAALITVTAFSGGMIRSPFSQFLVATFILAQVRAPLTGIVWNLFYAGLFASLVAQIAYWQLGERWPAGFDSLILRDHLYIAPTIVVALAGSVVNYFTVKDELENSSATTDTPGAQ